MGVAEKATNWIGSSASLIAHTVFFAGSFALRGLGVEMGEILLVLTTIVSLEAIYLAIFIQMTVNRSVKSLREVETDIDAIQADVGEMEKDIGEIQTDIDKLDLEEEQTTMESSKELLKNLSERLQKLSTDLEALRGKQQPPATGT